MKDMIYVYSKFKKRLILISTFFCILQVTSIYLFNYVLTKNKYLQLLSNIGIILTLATIFLFPFLAFKYESTEKSRKFDTSPWHFGFIINLPIISLGFLIGLIDVGLRILWTPDNYWSKHWLLYIVLLIFGSMFYILLSGFASWLASLTNKNGKKV